MAVNTSHPFFLVYVWDQLQEEAPVAEVLIVKAASNKRRSILLAFHLSVIIQSHPCAPVVAGSAAIISYSVGYGVSYRVPCSFTIYCRIAATISAIL